MAPATRPNQISDWETQFLDSTAQSSIRQQCGGLGLHRSAYYYQPVAAPAEDLMLMRLPDEQYRLTPQYGYRKMQLALQQKGHTVNHKRVRRLMHDAADGS